MTETFCWSIIWKLIHFCRAIPIKSVKLYTCLQQHWLDWSELTIQTFKMEIYQSLGSLDRWSTEIYCHSTGHWQGTKMVSILNSWINSQTDLCSLNSIGSRDHLKRKRRPTLNKSWVYCEEKQAETYYYPLLMVWLVLQRRFDVRGPEITSVSDIVWKCCKWKVNVTVVLSVIMFGIRSVHSWLGFDKSSNPSLITTG